MSQIEIGKLPQMSEIWQQTLNWQPKEEQEQQFQRVYQEILKGNRQQNLTRITTPIDFWEKHLWDSLSGIVGLDTNYLTQQLKVIDIGTGAGFPGIPLAIAFPEWKITLLDSTQKKITFLNTLIAKLDLKNANAVVARAEALGQEKCDRETYNLALIRAVSKASVCAEYSLPFVKVGGLAILYRGYWSEEETASLKSAVSQLSSEIELIYPWETPVSKGVRNCVYIRKHSATPGKFPRAVGVPEHQPL